MNIVNYVKKYYNKLPKSSFNDEELIIVMEIKNHDMGYSHHSYEGIGIDSEGVIHWCYSSGCSCNGSCDANPTKTFKKLQIEGYDLSKIEPKTVNFENLQVSFSDY